MLNPIQVAGLGVLSVLLLVQLRYASRESRPVLWVLTLIDFVYFAYSGGVKLDWHIREWSHNFVVSEHYITVATWMIVLVLLAVRYGYSIPLRPKRTGATRAVICYNQLLLLNLLGLGAMILAFYLNGGIVRVWSRTIEDEPMRWYGIVTGLSELALIYPLFNYYYYEESTRQRLTISAIILVVYFVFALLSGVSHDHVPRLAAFMLVWLGRSKLTLRRAAIVLLVGFTLISVMRFSRQVGISMYFGGGLSDAYKEYTDPDNSLNAINSFGELVTFSQVIQIVNKRTGWQMGKSYLLLVEWMIPGVLIPEKGSALRNVNSQGFLTTYYGRISDYWTSGFYGEAYVNFGLPGVILISCIVGVLARIAECLLASRGSLSWLPHWYIGCLLTGALLAAYRSDLGAGLVEFCLRPLGLAILLGEVMGLMLPYRPVQIERVNVRERLAMG